MIKVALFDDEYIVVEALQVLVPWETLGMELIATAHDGNQALHLIRERKPQIVLSDIRMPGIDGLQLVEMVKEEQPQTYFIIFSGYNDYEYVKQAIQLGVTDYLEKPITELSIEKALLKVKNHIELNQRLQSMNHQLQKVNEEKKIMYLKEFLITQISWNHDIELYNDKTSSYFHKYTILASNLPFQGIDQLSICHITFMINEIYILVLLEQKHSEINIQELLVFILEDNQKVGIGQSYEHIEKLKISYKEALLALELSILLREHDIVAFATYHEMIQAKDELSQLDTIRSNMILAFDNCDMEMLAHLYARLKHFCLFSKLPSSILEGELLYLLLSLSKVIDPSSSSIYTPIHDLRFTKNRLQLWNWFSNEYEPLTNCVLANKNDLPAVIKKAVQYMNENLERDFSLQDVAEYAGLSSPYFSILFKETMGMKFVAYRTKTKMEYAMKLLEQGYTVSEVSAKVGFLTYKHFSELFKKHTGTTPGHYKELRSK